MFVKQSYEEAFEHLLLTLKDKYPKALFELEGISEADLDITAFAKKYFAAHNTADVSVDANANIQVKNVSTYKSESVKGIEKLNSFYLFWKKAKKLWGTTEANRLFEKNLIKEINIQDPVSFYLPYCFAFSTIDLVDKGLPFIATQKSSGAKHGLSLLRQTEQLIQYASKQFQGATACPDVLVVFSALLKKDLENPNYYMSHINKPEILDQFLEQAMQEFVYTMSHPSKDSAQCPFVNITIFDKFFLEEYCKMNLVSGEFIDADFAMKIQKTFLKSFNKFNEHENFTFPVLTAQFKKTEDGEIEDEEFLDFISEINLPTGHLNIYSDTNLTALSSCCRLVNNIDDIIKAKKEENANLIGGSTIKVGSLGVTTINLVRVAILSKGNKESFFKILEENAKDCYKINHCRRELIKERIAQNQMPLYTNDFVKLENQYSTLGINGLYEAVALMGFDLVEGDEGKNFAIELFTKLNEIADHSISKYGYRCNIEQIPAENTAIKLAKADKLLFGQKDYELYGNQFIPLTVEVPMKKRVELQALFEKYFSGGTILHINYKEAIPTKKMMKQIIKDIVKAGVKYFAVNYFLTKCSNGHFECEHPSGKCGKCGAPILERYTRIVGFRVPVSSWSELRRKEYTERKKY